MTASPISDDGPLHWVDQAVHIPGARPLVAKATIQGPAMALPDQGVLRIQIWMDLAAARPPTPLLKGALPYYCVCMNSKAGKFFKVYMLFALHYHTNCFVISGVQLRSGSLLHCHNIKDSLPLSSKSTCIICQRRAGALDESSRFSDAASGLSGCVAYVCS